MSGYLDKLREHQFDGIQEFDNYLPKWWLWTFYLACIFAAIYWFYYQGSGFGQSAEDRYEAAFAAKMEKAASGQPVTRDLLLNWAKQPAAVEAGKAVFMTNCSVCHTEDGRGLAGPNLTDKYWLHGGKIENIYKTVSEGSPTNATMVAWLRPKGVLSRKNVLDVVSFVMTLKNTNKPGKAPEGKPEN